MEVFQVRSLSILGHSVVRMTHFDPHLQQRVAYAIA